MKKNILIISLLFILVTINSYSLDINNYDFFGFKLSYKLKDIKDKLNQEGKKYKTYTEFDEFDEFGGTEYLVLEPENQNIVELENLDYSILFYNDVVVKITKFLVKNNYIDKLKKDFGNYNLTEIHGSYKFFIWKINNEIELIIKEDLDKSDKKFFFSLEIINNNIDEMIIESKNIKNNIFTPTITNLRFRETPNSNGKIIRTLTKGEKLEFVEKGKEETINGVIGNWVKVKTDKGEVGWCFDGYLEEVER